jgi:hypothetical protein
MNVTKGLFVVTGSLFSSPLGEQHDEIVKRLHTMTFTRLHRLWCDQNKENVLFDRRIEAFRPIKTNFIFELIQRQTRGIGENEKGTNRLLMICPFLAGCKGQCSNLFEISLSQILAFIGKMNLKIF